MLGLKRKQKSTSSLSESIRQTQKQGENQQKFSGKIQGWLILYAINLVVLPLYLLYDLISSRTTNIKDLEKLPQGVKNEFHNLILTAQATDFILIVLLLVLSYNFFTKKRVTRNLAILTSLALIFAGILFSTLLSNFIKNNGGDSNNIPTSYASGGTIIWLFYWIYSKRVKATFGGGGKSPSIQVGKIANIFKESSAGPEKPKPRSSKKKPLLIAVIVVAGMSLLAAVGLIGLKAYHKYQVNKIYAVGEKVNYPGFNVVLTKAEAKPVNLPLDNKLVQKYGSLDKNENCDTISKASTLTHLGSPELVPFGPSDYNLCIRRNNSRQEIKKYSDANHQLVVDYKITANETVNTSQLKIQLIPDSGRKLTLLVNELNCNEFINPSTFDFNGTRITNTECNKYIPYIQSDIGENISKGLTRSGYLYTDIRNSEHSTDFIMTYSQNGKEYIRTTRIYSPKK